MESALNMTTNNGNSNSTAVAEKFCYDAPSMSNKISLSFASINRIELEANNNNNKGYNVIIACKDLRVVRLGFSGGEKYATQFYYTLMHFLLILSVFLLFLVMTTRYNHLNGLEVDDVGSSKTTTSVDDINKLASELSYTSITPTNTGTSNSKDKIPVSAIDGWKVYNVNKECIPQSVLPPSCSSSSSTNEQEASHDPPLQSHWRLWSDNYALVPTYSSSFILPSVLNTTDITEAAKFRSRHRLPVLTWQSAKNIACLCRSS